MRILFFCDSSSIHSKTYIDFFMANGHECKVVSYAPVNVTSCKDWIRLSEKIVRTGGNNIHYLFGIPKLSCIIKEYHPDCINCHFSYSYGFLGALAVMIARCPSRLSIVCHGSDVLDPPLPLIAERLNKFAFSQSDCIIVASDAILDRIERYGYGQKAICRQYGVEAIDSNATVRNIDVISLRAYVPNSRIDEMLNAISSVAKKKCISAFAFIPLANSETLKRLRRTFNKIEINPALVHSDVITYLKRTKVYVSATRSDGSSLALMEAMAAGCFPVVSNIPANRSWIVDGINGFMFRTWTEFERKLETALSDDSLRRKASEMNRSLIATYHERNLALKEIEELITGKSG